MRKYKYNPKDRYNRRRNRADRYNKIDEIKMSNFCQMCGYTNPDYPSTLDFDHQHDKIGCISNLASQARSWDVIFAEIMKCRLLCRICHSIKTADERRVAIK
tara:strand:- start:3144 stop:3449 length:306 start_codon:yes stop_codon:yes gene_type:complete